MLAVTAFVVTYFVLFIAAMLAFDEGNRRLGWIFLSGIGLEAVVWFGVVLSLVLVRCPDCRRWTVPRRLREVATFVEESGRYAVVRVCPTCWPRLFERMESDLFQFMDPAKRLEPFLELLRDSNVEVPASTDWRATRRWMKEVIHALQAAHGA